MAAAGAFSRVGASGVQCDKMSDAWLGARGRTRRGQDSVWAHFELLLSLSFFPFPPPRFILHPPPYFIMFLLFTPHLPFSSFHIFIRPFPLSISSLCVSERFGVGPHSVSHSSSINDQLEHGATQSLLTPPLLLSHTDTHTHHFNYFRLLWRQVSIFLSIPRPLQSLATSLPPSQWIYLPRLITRSSNQRCMASPVMSVREEEQDRKKDREGGCVDG